MRRTCRKYHNLVNSYMYDISTSVAQGIFPASKHLLKCFVDLKNNEKPIERLRRLKWLRFDYLTAILLEKLQRGSIAAEDSLGDDLRSMLEGWHVLARLSKFYHTQSTADGTSCLVHLNYGTREPEHSRQIKADQETELACRWLLMIESLTVEELKGYKWLQSLLIGHVFGFEDPFIAKQRKNTSYDAVAWVWAHAIKQDPGPCWNAFCMRAPFYTGTQSLKTDIEAAWVDTNATFQEWELDSIHCIDRGTGRLLKHAHPSIRKWLKQRRLSDLLKDPERRCIRW